MLETLAKTGLSGGIGFLVGLGLLLWIEPLTQGGRLALMLISIVTSMVLGQLIGLLRRRPATEAKPPPDPD